MRSPACNRKIGWVASPEVHLLSNKWSMIFDSPRICKSTQLLSLKACLDLKNRLAFLVIASKMFSNHCITWSTHCNIKVISLFQWQFHFNQWKVTPWKALSRAFHLFPLLSGLISEQRDLDYYLCGKVHSAERERTRIIYN